MSEKWQEEGGQTTVDIDARTEVRKPKKYKVLMLNDDYTTMEFVIYVLKSIFHKSEEKSFELMLEVHHNGAAVCGIYSLDIAQTKVERVISEARASDFPLQATIEVDS